MDMNRSTIGYIHCLLLSTGYTIAETVGLPTELSTVEQFASQRGYRDLQYFMFSYRFNWRVYMIFT